MFIECISPYYMYQENGIITIWDTDDLSVERIRKQDLYFSDIDFIQRPNMSSIGGITDMHSYMASERLSGESRGASDAIAVSFIYVDNIPVRILHFSDGEWRINNFVLTGRRGSFAKLSFNYIVAFKGYYLIRLVTHSLGSYNLGYSALMNTDGKVLDYWVKGKAHHNISRQSEILGIL